MAEPVRETLVALAGVWTARAAELRAQGLTLEASRLERLAGDVGQALAGGGAGSSAPAPLTDDRLWTIEQAAQFFHMGAGWVREHVPAVILPGQGDRRAVRYRPETCRHLARQFETNRITSEDAA